MRTWRRVVIAVMVVATALLFYRWWQAASSKARPNRVLEDTVVDGVLRQSPAATAGGAAGRAGAPEHEEPSEGPKLDRARADKMRAELHALFAEAGPLVLLGGSSAEPMAPVDAGFPTMPVLGPGEGGDTQVDPKYIQKRVREDLFPLAKNCYGDALKRNPKLGGKLVVFFRIIGDKKVGGVVDEARMTEETTIDDAEMQTCVRESMMSVSFDAPPGDQEITVVYPILFSPEDDEAGSE
jgi:hypothetical protein